MSKLSSRGACAAIVAIGLLAVAPAAWGDVIQFDGTGPGGLSATVIFEDMGGFLHVTLINTSGADVLVPTQVLTAVFFTSPDVTLTPISAALHNGSIVYNGPAPGGFVSGEWAYNSTAGGDPFPNPFGANSGISSVGLGTFGPPDLFPGPNLDGPASPNGIQYGITSAGDNLATGNAPIIAGPLIQNSVGFILSGWTGNVNDITNVWFQYGSEFGEPSFPGGNVIPEPGMLALLGLGLGGLYVAHRRRPSRAPR